jgi:hypothetical protein
VYCSPQTPAGQDEEGFVEGRYACFYSFDTWRRLVSRSGFALVDQYFRPPGKPRSEQLARHALAQSGIARPAHPSLKVRRSAHLVRRLRRFAGSSAP